MGIKNLEQHIELISRKSTREDPRVVEVKALGKFGIAQRHGSATKFVKK